LEVGRRHIGSDVRELKVYPKMECSVTGDVWEDGKKPNVNRKCNK